MSMNKEILKTAKMLTNLSIVLKEENQIDSKEDSRLMVKIADQFRFKNYFSRYDYLAVEFCHACDKLQVVVRDCDPGSTEEAIGYTQFCDSCSKDLDSKPEFFLADMENDILNKYRKSKGLKSLRTVLDIWYLWINEGHGLGFEWGEMLEQFEKLKFDATEEDVAKMFELYTMPPDVELSPEEEADMMWVYGVGPKPRHNMSAQDEAYEDLTIERYRELGGSYY